MNVRQTRPASRGSGPKIFFCGGGGGSSVALPFLRRVAGHISALINVADDGAGSARLLGGLGYPPGDLRRAMLALAADPDGLLARMCRVRFDGRFPQEAGQSFGNLLFAAAETACGDMVHQIAAVARLLDVQGDVFPATYDGPITLVGEMTDGAEVMGETAIAAYPAAVRRVRLEPAQVTPPAEALDRIAEADWVVLGPGSIFTSLLPVLLVPGVADAIARSRAARFLIMNGTHESEHDHRTTAEYMCAIADHFPGQRLFDYVILNSAAPGSASAAALTGRGLRPVDPSPEAICALGYTPVVADLLAADGRHHDGARLAALLSRVAAAAAPEVRRPSPSRRPALRRPTSQLTAA